MQLNPENFDDLLARFLDTWNLERIKSMTIEEYADLSNHESLCYWLEYETEQLGAIGGVHLNKFELWKPLEDNKLFKDNRFNLQNGYAWNARKGDTLEEAFQNIRQLLVDIVTYSQQHNWKAIDDIPFHAIGKWKLAFLFSDKRILPVYSKRALLPIAEGFGHYFMEKERVSVIHAAILSHKLPEEHVVDFAHRIYTQFAERNRIMPPNFYIIGSKYNGNESVMNRFQERSCVAMGWIDWMDFSECMGANTSKINQFVDDNYEEVSPSPSKIKGFFRRFAQLKEGDIIAVKSHGSHGMLTIIAYAQVVKRDGSIYFHDEDFLGHHINVEFLEAGFSKSFNETYAETLHQLTPAKDKQTFFDIFGWYTAQHATGSNTNTEEYLKNDVTPSDQLDEPEDYATEPIIDKGYNDKIESSFERSAAAAVIVNRMHNYIQNRFIKYLNENYPDDDISGEKRYVDAKRVTPDHVFIYEIKPVTCVYSCIRQSIGQLLDYLHQDNTKREKRVLVVVGSSHPNSDDLRFLHGLRQLLKVPIRYLAFNCNELSAREY